MKMNNKPQLPTSEISILSADKIQIEYERKVSKYFYLEVSIVITAFVSAFIGMFFGLLDNIYFRVILVMLWMIPMVSIIIENIRSFQNPERNYKKVTIKKNVLELEPINKRSELEIIQTPINQHIDFKVNILENRVDVGYFNTIIPLYETASLPVLIDGIANMYDFEFYDSAQLFDETEVLTYKSKRVKEPNFPSLLIIQNRNRNLKIFDLLNQGNWLEFDFRVGEVYRSNIGITDTFQVLIIQLQKIEIFAFRGEYFKGNSNIQIKLTLGNGYKLDVFQTKNRKPEQELTTVRDAKAIYKLLKMNDNLKHVEVALKEL